jgi:phosphatidylserine/phosphatidylglycerophosphate/cardiolipin synthase-like enzyme
MDELHAAVAAVAATHHRDRVIAAAMALRASRNPNDAERARSILGPTAGHGSGDPLEDIIAICRQRGAWDGPAIASALEGAAAAIALIESRQAIEIAWTGPSPHRTALRRTEQVIRQVVDSARSHIWLVSFVVYDPYGIANALSTAIARGVVVSALLESPKARGGTLEQDPAISLSAAVPGIRFYEWPSCADRGSVHAKCIIADNSMAFVTSANLTGAAMERNIELGILIRGGTQPAEMSNHLSSLIEEGLITSSSIL